MFGRKGAIKVTYEKDKKQEPQDTSNPTFYQKADYVLRKAENVGVKVFAGICIYVVLNAVCEVFVEVNKLPPLED